MEKNIFEEAKFGDKFSTRDGRIALYLGKGETDNLTTYFLYCKPYTENIEYECEEYIESYNSEGRIGYFNSNKDIISRYQEPIDEEKLDLDSNLYAANIAGEDKSLFEFLKLAMEYGYRKAMEEM